MKRPSDLSTLAHTAAIEGSASLKLVGCVTSAPKIMKGVLPMTGTATD